MRHLIYEKTSGRIEGVREIVLDGSALTGAEVIVNLYGTDGAQVYASQLYLDSAAPVGKKVDTITGALVADPAYVPPPAAP